MDKSTTVRIQAVQLRFTAAHLQHVPGHVDGPNGDKHGPLNGTYPHSPGAADTELHCVSNFNDLGLEEVLRRPLTGQNGANMVNGVDVALCQKPNGDWTPSHPAPSRVTLSLVLALLLPLGIAFLHSSRQTKGIASGELQARAHARGAPGNGTDEWNEERVLTDIGNPQMCPCVPPHDSRQHTTPGST